MILKLVLAFENFCSFLPGNGATTPNLFANRNLRNRVNTQYVVVVLH